MNEMIEDYKIMSLREMSKKYNVSAMTIRKRLKKLNIDTSYNLSMRPPELDNIDYLENKFKNNISYKELANELKVSKNTVIAAVCRCLKVREFIFIGYDELCKLRKNNLIVDIANLFDSTLQVVVYNLKYYNLEIKSNERQLDDNLPGIYYSDWKKEFNDYELCFKWLIKNGFKHVEYSNKVLIDAIDDIKNAEPNLNTSNGPRSASLLIKHFSDHFYYSTHDQYNTVSSAWEIGNQSVLKNALKMIWNKDKKCNIYTLVRTIAKHFKDFTTVSIFKPWVASYIYNTYLPNGGIVVDPCMGWGGRLLGCLNKNIEYIGYDFNINSVDSNKKLSKFIKFDKCEFIYADSSIVDFKQGDLLFTSPPYDDTELYYGIDSCKTVTEPIYNNIFNKFNGIIALNVPLRHEELCKSIGNKYNYKLFDKHEMKTNSFMGREKTYEPILVFKK
jgi:hypothetical protein